MGIDPDNCEDGLRLPVSLYALWLEFQVVRNMLYALIAWSIKRVPKQLQAHNTFWNAADLIGNTICAIRIVFKLVGYDRNCFLQDFERFWQATMIFTIIQLFIFIAIWMFVLVGLAGGFNNRRRYGTRHARFDMRNRTVRRKRDYSGGIF